MRITTRSSRLVLLAGLMALAWASAPRAADQATLERARDQGVIRVGFANEAPFGYADLDGRLTGEAPEIARIVFARMGIPRVEGVLTEWASLIPGLKAERFDVIAAGMYVLPERCKEVAFSEPTYRLGQTFLVQAGNPKDLHGYADVAESPDVTLGIMAGAVERGYARRAGVPDDQVVILPDQASMLSAVRSGRIDAAALTPLSIQRMADLGGPRVARARPFATPPWAYGYGAFAFRKEDTALLEAFNRELEAFVGTERHLATIAPFGFTEAELPGETTTAELCAGER